MTFSTWKNGWVSTSPCKTKTFSLVRRIFLYGFCLSRVYISKLSIDKEVLNLCSYVIHIFYVRRFVPKKPKNFRSLCVLCFFLKLRSSRYMFIKTSWNISLSYLWKITSVYILKLGISHYVLTGAAEVIHISIVKLAFSLLFLLVHVKNKLFFRVYRDQWGISGFLFINSGFTGLFVEINWKQSLWSSVDLRT